MFSQSQHGYVSVAHRYWNSTWSDAQNKLHYSAQASEDGVGSNLRLEITLNSEQDASTELEQGLAKLKRLVDHHCFFTDFAEFQSRPSTLESITVFLAQTLFAMPLPQGQWTSIAVAENSNLICSVRPECALVEMTIKILNLTFTLERKIDPDTGLAISRSELWQIVRTVAPDFAQSHSGNESAWAESLWSAFHSKVKGLTDLRIDLGSQRFLRVHSKG